MRASISAIHAGSPSPPSSSSPFADVVSPSPLPREPPLSFPLPAATRATSAAIASCALISASLSTAFAPCISRVDVARFRRTQSKIPPIPKDRDEFPSIRARAGRRGASTATVTAISACGARAVAADVARVAVCGVDDCTSTPNTVYP
jgi:hypothetical protein